jgi:hypothetical protein
MSCAAAFMIAGSDSTACPPDTLDAAMHGIDTVLLVSPAVPAQEIAS